MTLLGVQPVFSMGTASAPAVDMSLGMHLHLNEAFDSSIYRRGFLLHVFSHALLDTVV
jgi:hypothetical protein